jgi:drug/metabolite transporter (DMT)-like permease
MSGARTVRAPADRPLAGIGLMVLAVALLTAMDGIAKYLTQSLPLAEVVWARYAFNLIALLAVLPAWRVAIWRTRQALLQVLRGLMMIVATGLMFLALSLIPMAEAYAINYISPLLVAVMAAAWLGERVGLQRWLAMAAGFLGVMLVIRPGSGLFGLAALAPLGAATAFAVYQLVTRMLARDHVLVTMFYSATTGTLATSLFLPFVWQAPGLPALALMLLMGGLGLAGQLAMIKAFALGPAATISPYIYSQIVFAALFGFLVFGDRPDLFTWLGAGVVAVSGLHLLRYEARGPRGRRAA